MLAYLIPIVAGCAVFSLFILVFIRRDDRGQRGGRLAGCAHHDAGQRCDRCHDRQPVTLRPRLPGGNGESGWIDGRRSLELGSWTRPTGRMAPT